jgi:uncharacterized protein YbjQ (UPF0145 family)
MSLFGSLFGASDKDPRADALAAERARKWNLALENDEIPDFVQARLKDAAAGKIPWMSTMTPAELLLSRGLGIRPVATVSATCWYHYGYSWTNGHAEGWRIAQDRIREEARAAGANAVVDAKLRTINLGLEDSMDFTIVGTAVRIEGLPPSPDPVISTVSAVEFVRLLREGIVPTGIAVGAHYEWLNNIVCNVYNPTAAGSWMNQPLPELSEFWRRVRQRAVYGLKQDAKRLGDGVLAHTNFGQLLRFERDQQTPQFLGRFIVIGTTVQCKANDNILAKVRTVIDMRDDLSPLLGESGHGHTAYPVETEKEGGI